ncbi:molybdate ABC transporter substrate-binding protein [Raineyella sp. LH-20]|uniref:molybdate ABC transporter substrate-binding protein n=1 Tax=Raineyella sp. LH-20 TaxID=3081204 RepID=UPI002954EC58|nr:molybdate ABC transporter substrate-binding protein [Raineyella sp. LH-20]WOP19905.1 molybdate ABC transporter substrate-binding protein [Raineyella sp. LH-20]
MIGIVLVLAALLGLGGCGSAARSTSGPSGVTSAAQGGSTPRVTLTVFAAASLAGPFDEIGTAFGAAHPGVTVRYSYGGSSDLVSQLAAGAPADVLATADERTMQQARDKALVPQSTLFATNQLAILVAPHNPLGITGAKDLARSGLKVVVCAPQVPCGAATERALQAAGIPITPVSEEANVTDTAGKVTSGQADAAVVYATDVAKAEAAGTGTGVPLGVEQTPNRYPIGVTAGGASGANADVARAYVAYVTGAEGQAILARAGFGKP